MPPIEITCEAPGYFRKDVNVGSSSRANDHDEWARISLTLMTLPLGLAKHRLEVITAGLSALDLNRGSLCKEVRTLIVSPPFDRFGEGPEQEARYSRLEEQAATLTLSAKVMTHSLVVAASKEEIDDWSGIKLCLPKFLKVLKG